LFLIPAKVNVVAVCIRLNELKPEKKRKKLG
jgi:hypothetical protein